MDVFIITFRGVEYSLESEDTINYHLIKRTDTGITARRQGRTWIDDENEVRTYQELVKSLKNQLREQAENK